MSMLKYTLLLCWFCCSINALQAQTIAGIVADATTDGEMVLLTWAPVNDTIWALGNKFGYSVQRRDKDQKTVTLASGVKPMPYSWFEANQGLDNGFLFVIGKILHDPEYNKKVVSESLSNQRIQYEYLVPEAIRSPQVARCLGLGFLDSTCVRGHAYTYEIFFIDSVGRRYSSAVTISLNDESGDHSTHVLADMNFDPPGGTSLFNMRTDLPGLRRIELAAKAFRDSIVLRWAPNDHVFWAQTKNEPYAVFRIVESIGDDTLEPDYILLDSIRPWSLEMFTPQMVAKDSLILVAAQSLYGAHESSEADGVIIQHSESVMRYGMAMLAADRSPLAADALGLRFVDKDVKPGNTYRYVILTRAADNVMENGFVDVINVRDTFSRIEGFLAEPKDKKINLVWSKRNDQFFSGYLLSRSDDGGRTFKPINETPFLFIQNQHTREDGNYSFLDSIESNYKRYQYGIQGIDAFGDTSALKIISAYGVDRTPPARPEIYFAESDSKQNIHLKWQMPVVDADLDKFHILLAGSVEGDYIPVSGELPGTERSFIYREEINTNRAYYFIVVAQDTAGNQQLSLPAFVHLIDSVPPSAPKNLRGLIDSLGIVNITWDHGTEPDLIGYRIYMGNNPAHEFTQLSKTSTPLNVWRDSIELLTLDKKVYYKVVAVDRSNNVSSFSEILSLERPDIVRPAAPASLPSSSDSRGIRLKWSLSTSNDVVAYIIYRKDISRNDTISHRIARIQEQHATEWTDTTARYDQIYEYTIRAQDRSGLLSDGTFPVKGRRSFDPGLLTIEKLEAVYKKEYSAVYLRWNFDARASGVPARLHYYLYRKTDGESWKKIRQLDAAALSYLDRELKKDGNYTYGIKIVTADGKSGTIAESPVVNYHKNSFEKK